MIVNHQAVGSSPIGSANANVAQSAVRHLAKVKVRGSRPRIRSMHLSFNGRTAALYTADFGSNPNGCSNKTANRGNSIPRMPKGVALAATGLSGNGATREHS
jgi:hypothetical protein